MRDLLFLSHRIPYPPDKGEKIRAWHMLRHLARNWRIRLGCFVDDQADRAHLDTLRGICAEVAAIEIDRSRRQLAALASLRPGLPLTLGYFSDRRLRRWVEATLADPAVRHAFVYCSAMAPYVMQTGACRRILDMVDIDSEKWAEYARLIRSPARFVWAREGRTLLRFERRAASVFDRTIFVSQAERDRFAALVPDAASRAGWVENGVDLDRFAPGSFANPYPDARPAIVFTGTMDYWPNVDAVRWFAERVLPQLAQATPRPRFWIVGANPAAAVLRLADGETVRVTGRVADIRPYLARAAVVVAPLRVARGIQNKVLEAMAMARPVIASRAAFTGIEAMPGRDLLVADDAADMAKSTLAVLAGGDRGLGEAGRRLVLARYAWSRTLSGLDELIEGTG